MGVCQGIRSKRQLRQALEGTQVEDTIPGDVRGLGKKIRAALNLICTTSVWD